MQFSYIPRPSSAAEIHDAATFQIDRVYARHGAGDLDLSDLLDRSYGYHSPRELQWHLAERFGLPVHAVALSRR